MLYCVEVIVVGWGSCLTSGLPFSDLTNLCFKHNCTDDGCSKRASDRGALCPGDGGGASAVLELNKFGLPANLVFVRDWDEGREREREIGTTKKKLVGRPFEGRYLQREGEVCK